jgi:hypothetical protein
MAMSLVWLIPGMLLLGALVAGSISMWLKKRKEAKNSTLYGSRIRPDFTEENKDEK